MPDPIQVTPEAPSVNSVAPPTAPNLPPPSAAPTLDNSPTPPSFADVMSGQPSSPPDLGPNPQMPTLAAPEKPGIWRQVVVGALSGLAGSAGQKSFGGGLSAGAAGAIDQQRYERAKAIADANTQSQIRFRDFQAANLAAEAHLNDAKLAALPQQLQDQHNAANLELMQQLNTMGLRPVGVVPNTDQHVIAGMQQISQTHNGVPAMLTVNLGNKVVAYDLNQLAEGANDNTLALINKYGPVLGRPEITASQWATMPTKDRVDLIHSSVDALNIVPDPKNIGGQIATAQNRLATYQSLPEGKQDATIVKRLQQNVTMLQSAQKTFDQHEVAQAANKKGAETAAEAQAKAAYAAKKPDVLTGSLPDGTLVAGTAEELSAAGVKNPYKLPAADVSKMEVARQLVSPGGLFDNVAADISNLNKSGKLGVAASRWNDILTNKLGTGDQDYARLATDIGLLQTAVMQAHVGAKGGNEMLEHFKETIGDARISDAPTLLARLGASWDYMNHKAMRIPAKKAGQ